MEETTAALTPTPQGMIYTGKVKHFSEINMDVGGNNPLDATCVLAKSRPCRPITEISQYYQNEGTFTWTNQEEHCLSHSWQCLLPPQRRKAQKLLPQQQSTPTSMMRSVGFSTMCMAHGSL
jgi:hypothetical protein